MASIIIWQNILRFAGDLPEGSGKFEGNRNLIALLSSEITNGSFGYSGSQKSSNGSQKDGVVNSQKEGYLKIFEGKLTDMEKIQVIVLHGILRPDLR